MRTWSAILAVSVLASTPARADLPAEPLVAPPPESPPPPAPAPPPPPIDPAAEPSLAGLPYIGFLHRLFVHDDGRVRTYPTSFVETGIEPSIGGRVELRDLAGAGESFRVRAGYAGERRQVIAGHVNTGRALGRVQLELGAKGQRFDNIGVWPIGPMDGDVSRIRMDEGRTELSAMVDLGAVDVRPSVTYRDRRFDEVPGEEPPTVVGFVPRQRSVEGDLHVDWRRGPVRVGGWLNLHHGIEGDGSTHLRGGSDVAVRVRVHPDVTVGARGLIEGIDGDVDVVPFGDLPRLGGASLLRGYRRDRFRDRWIGVGLAEVMWTVHRWIGVFAFADLGRVAGDAAELVDPELLRASVGGGVALRGTSLRLHVATSIDGGVIVMLSNEDPLHTRTRGATR